MVTPELHIAAWAALQQGEREANRHSGPRAQHYRCKKGQFQDQQTDRQGLSDRALFERSLQGTSKLSIETILCSNQTTWYKKVEEKKKV